MNDEIKERLKNRLTLKRENVEYNGKILNEYDCSCGNIVYKFYKDVERGRVKSCGCMRGDRHKTHNKTKRRIYQTWIDMKKRCNYPKYRYYHRYGGRGIKVCDEWVNNFMAFFEWANSNGYSDNLSLDRIDNDKNYTPDNCRFVTQKEQVRNSSKSLNPEMVLLIKKLISENKQNKEISIITGVQKYKIVRIKSKKHYA